MIQTRSFSPRRRNNWHFVGFRARTKENPISSTRWNFRVAFLGSLVNTVSKSCITRSNFILKESWSAAKIWFPSFPPLPLFLAFSYAPLFTSRFSRMIQIRFSSARHAAFPLSRDVLLPFFCFTDFLPAFRKLFLLRLSPSPPPLSLSLSYFPLFSLRPSMCGTSRLIILILRFYFVSQGTFRAS